MLAASYGLVLHGYNLRRIQAGMQYVAVNLVASLLFLIGVSLIYAATGTLNMADLGARGNAWRAGHLAAANRRHRAGPGLSDQRQDVAAGFLCPPPTRRRPRRWGRCLGLQRTSCRKP